MGFVTLGIFMFSATALQGAILQMINHGLITAGSSFSWAWSTSGPTTDRSPRWAAWRRTMPIWATVFGFFILASAGLPACRASSGSSWSSSVRSASRRSSPSLDHRHGPGRHVSAVDVPAGRVRHSVGLPGRAGAHLTDMDRTEMVTLVPLAALIIVLGLFPSLLLDLLRAPAQAFLAAAGVPVGG